MKVGIYCRVSKGIDQDVTKQVDICKKYCEVQGYEIYKIYTDEISGTKESRPSFNKLLEDMRSYKFKAIVVTKLDRLGRSLRHLLSLFDEFNRKRVEFVAVTQNIDTTTSAGKLQLQIMGAFAEFERSLISERTKEGLSRAVGIGKRGRDKRPRKRREKLRKNKNYFQGGS